MQYLCSHRSQDETPETAVAMSGEHDEVDVSGVSDIDDDVGRIAVFQPAFHFQVTQLICQERIEKSFEMLGLLGHLDLESERAEIDISGPCDRLHNMEEDHFGSEASRDRFQVSCGSPAAVREVDGKSIF